MDNVRCKYLVLFLDLANTSAHVLNVSYYSSFSEKRTTCIAKYRITILRYFIMSWLYLNEFNKIWSLAIIFIHRNLFLNLKNILNLISHLVNYYYKVYRIFRQVVFHDISHPLWLAMIFWPSHHCSHRGGDSGEGTPTPLSFKTLDDKRSPNLSSIQSAHPLS